MDLPDPDGGDLAGVRNIVRARCGRACGFCRLEWCWFRLACKRGLWLPWLGLVSLCGWRRWMADPLTGCGLIGREAETGIIDRLLADAGSGRSGVLVLTGEAGVGKSALLAYARARAGDMRVLQTAGTLLAYWAARRVASGAAACV